MCLVFCFFFLAKVCGWVLVGGRCRCIQVSGLIGECGYVALLGFCVMFGCLGYIKNENAPFAL